MIKSNVLVSCSNVPHLRIFMQLLVVERTMSGNLVFNDAIQQLSGLFHVLILTDLLISVNQSTNCRLEEWVHLDVRLMQTLILVRQLTSFSQMDGRF